MLALRNSRSGACILVDFALIAVNPSATMLV